jgi:glycosyltransferase involved in cell wall biosynthesis
LKAGRQATNCKINLSPKSDKLGYSRAVLRGITQCKTKLIAFMDADGQYDPNDIQYLVKRLEKNELFGNKELFNKYHKYVFGPYKTHKWYNVPHNEKNQFMILQADVKEDRILIAYEVSEPFKREQRSYNLEGFLNFLHNPELFESKIRKIKKI